MARIGKAVRSSGATVLLVDDNVEYLQVTRRLLEHEGHTVLTAEAGPEALSILRKQHIDLVLLDYFMPGMTGEEVVRELRSFNSYVQVILQTGYSSEKPHREMLRRLDIQGYYDKTEGPEKLLLWTDVGLKAAYTVQLLDKSRQGLRHILDITPDLHRIQPLEELLQGVLLQVTGLLRVVNSFLAVLPPSNPGAASSPSPQEPEGFLAIGETEADLVVRAGTGRFGGRASVEQCLEPERLAELRSVLTKGQVAITAESTIVPLRVGAQLLGAIYLDRPLGAERDIELVCVFSNQAAVAIQNARLYQMATQDRVTGVFVRHFFEQWMHRELRIAYRARQPLTLLMLDLDNMKGINDTAGHLAGDQALLLVGKTLRQATRSSEIVGRYGGDEFAVVLPSTDLTGAQVVARRVFDLLKSCAVPGPQGPIPIRASIGLGGLLSESRSSSDIPHLVPHSFFTKSAEHLIRHTDKALYQAKRAGGNQFYFEEPIDWPPNDEE